MAVLKDYYKMLNVKPSASAAEIKTAYRRLAMKYHPDRNPDDALAAAVFADIAEAYNVLSDVAARKEYNHKRYTTAAEEYQKPQETIETLILRIDKIARYSRNANAFHLNKDALLYSIQQLIPTDIDLLLHTNSELIEDFLLRIYGAAQHLSSRQTKQLILLLDPLYIQQAWLKEKLNTLLKYQLKKERWEKNKIVLALVVAILLCLIIFFTAGK